MLKGFLGVGGSACSVALFGNINSGFQMNNAFAGVRVGFCFFRGLGMI